MKHIPLWSPPAPGCVSFFFGLWLHLYLLFNTFLTVSFFQSISIPQWTASGALGRSKLPPHNLFLLFLLFCHEHLEFPILWQPFIPHLLLHNCIFHLAFFPILVKHLFSHVFQPSPFLLSVSHVLTPSSGPCSPLHDKSSSHHTPSGSHISITWITDSLGRSIKH